MYSTALKFALFRLGIMGVSMLPFVRHAEADTNAAPADVDAKHVMVYHEPGRFGGWPANHGMWAWGNELLVGFSAGMHKDLGDRHNIDREKPEHHWLARSLDGGETWTIEYPDKKGILIGAPGMRHGTMPPDAREPEPVPCPGGIDFTHPDFAMTCRMEGIDSGQSRFYYSYDRGHNWQGPFRLPLFGQPGIAARTDYIVDGKNDCMLFLTASKKNVSEGRLICVRTTDGGKTWNLVSKIGPEPTGFAIMPSSVRLSDNEILTTARRREGEGEPEHRWIEVWRSKDNGETWTFNGNPVEDVGVGNPPCLIKLADGRLCLTYGDRKPPYRICAKLSSDGGETWGDEITLRTGGANRDLGYVRSLQRPDGKVVTLYYFSLDEPGPERFIAATIWTPPVD